MKLFDWLILLLATPWFILALFGWINGNAHPLVKAGVAEASTKGWHVLIPLGAILFTVYRVWG